MARRILPSRTGWTILDPKGRPLFWAQTRAEATDGYVAKRADGKGWRALVAERYSIVAGRPVSERR